MKLETNKHKKDKTNQTTAHAAIQTPNVDTFKLERSGVISFKSLTLVQTLANLVETGMSHMMDWKEHLHQDKGNCQFPNQNNIYCGKF